MKKLLIPSALLVTFILWTFAISTIDVQTIGPMDSSVGFATVNQFFHNFTGVNLPLYNLTDILSIIPLAICLCFGILGLIQWISRKSLLKVDRDIIALGIFYVIVMAAFVLFEIFPVNFRPVLIEGALEASYPSSTTMLFMCVMPTAVIQFNNRIGNIKLRRLVSAISIVFTAFMVAARLVSGVHWLTDIIGGILLSSALVSLYKMTYK